MANLIEAEGIESHSLWLELVSAAAYRPGRAETVYGTVELERGELIFSYRTYGERLGLTMAQVRTRVERWARNGQIRKRPLTPTRSAHHRAHPPQIITIIDYDTYSPPSLGGHTPSRTQDDIEQSTSDTEEEGTMEKNN
ncbi:MAG TPA: hypothetical protein VF846_07320 [Thermoanaerobaculia bacterium]|jgi:hypothetical protein